MAPEKLGINKFFVMLLTYFRYRINEITQYLTKYDGCSERDKLILQEWIDWEESCNYGGNNLFQT